MEVRTVPISEFKAHLNAHLASGDQVQVTRRGQLVAIVSPPDAELTLGMDPQRSSNQSATSNPGKGEVQRGYRVTDLVVTDIERADARTAPPQAQGIYRYLVTQGKILPARTSQPVKQPTRPPIDFDFDELLDLERSEREFFG
jgi:antitoxin (DNA-binding transcriptional repressor) of toxin-antitoxin stability system